MQTCLSFKLRFPYVAILTFCLTLFVGFAISGFANDMQYEAFKLAREYAPKIINDKYDGGAVDINTQLIDYIYSPQNKAWIIRMNMVWKGVFSGKVYECAGDLDISPQGWKWSYISMNDTLRGWLIMKYSINELDKYIQEQNKRKSGGS